MAGMKKQVLHTIGYEGVSIDAFLEAVERAGVQILIDVRDVPISRKKGFSKSKLSDALQECGIDYLHLKGLGDPKPGRIAAREGRIADFKKIFKAHMRSEVAQFDLEKAIGAARNRIACLMCFEKEHIHCHRCFVAEKMAKKLNFELVHLSVDVAYASDPRLGRKHSRNGTPIYVG